MPNISFREQPEPEPHATSRADASRLDSSRWLWRAGIGSWLLLGIGAGVAALVLLLALASEVAIPLAVAIVLAAVLVPVADWLERPWVPRWLAATSVLVLGMMLVAGTIAVVIYGIVDQSDEIWAHLEDGLRGLNSEFGGTTEDAARLVSAGHDVADVLTSGLLGPIAGTIGALIVSSVLAAFMLLFLLKDWDEITEWTIGLVPGSDRAGRSIIDSVVSSFRAYVKSLTLLGIANGVMVGLGAWILGVPLVGTIALISFLTSYIPYLGAFVAGAMAVLIAYGSGGSGDAILMLAVVLLANGLLQNVLEPFAFGRYLRLHPLAVLVIVLAASLLFGVVGAILAAPLASAAMSAHRALHTGADPHDTGHANADRASA